jgi:hypothetical protein
MEPAKSTGQSTRRPRPTPRLGCGRVRGEGRFGRRKAHSLTVVEIRVPTAPTTWTGQLLIVGTARALKSARLCPRDSARELPHKEPAFQCLADRTTCDSRPRAEQTKPLSRPAATGHTSFFARLFAQQRGLFCNHEHCAKRPKYCTSSCSVDTVLRSLRRLYVGISNATFGLQKKHNAHVCFFAGAPSLALIHSRNRLSFVRVARPPRANMDGRGCGKFDSHWRSARPAGGRPRPAPFLGIIVFVEQRR